MGEWRRRQRLRVNGLIVVETAAQQGGSGGEDDESNNGPHELIPLNDTPGFLHPRLLEKD
jgi:hypothetical protein